MNTRDKIVGKDHYNFYPKDVADVLVENNNKVIELGQAIEFEEQTVDINTGLVKYFTSVRSALRDDDNNIIGIIGASVDITAQRAAEHLKLENHAYIIRAEEDKKLRKIVEQVVHDIKSPIATLQMILPNCEITPERSRIYLNKSATKIQDIANTLLKRFSTTSSDADSQDEFKRTKSLLSANILETISEKRFEYAKSSVNFITKITPAGYFACIDVDISKFRRMMSNLINNGVDAIQESTGVVTIHLDASDNRVKIIIEDDGCGMPESVKDKLLKNIKVTEGKKDGHGIGFGQIRDTINENEGTLEIISTPRVGTKIILTFPQAKTPEWLCSTIEFNNDDLVIILDDEPSIHGAWDARFEKLSSQITWKHFENSTEAIEFINGLTTTRHVFMLTDYELLKQNMNGLDVIAQTKISRSVLVTSHYNNEEIHKRAQALNTKILPKPLAAEIPITISKNIKTKETEVCELKKIKPRNVDLVIIDDDKLLVDTLINYQLQGRKIDFYHKAWEFLQYMSDYDKTTKFLVGNEFKHENIDGIEICTRLHKLGFQKIYLFSCESDLYAKAPYYVVHIINKTDSKTVKNLAAF